MPWFRDYFPNIFYISFNTTLYHSIYATILPSFEHATSTFIIMSYAEYFQLERLPTNLQITIYTKGKIKK